MAMKPKPKLFRIGLIITLATVAGRPTPGWAQSTGAFGTDSWLEWALRGRIYFLAPYTQRLPDLRSLRPMGTIYTQKLNVPTRAWQEGFPGVSSRFEWFAIEYDGLIRVRRSGHYLLRLVSDDGSKLFIDRKLIIDNDGVHPTRSAGGSVDLDAGQHTIRIQYFQGPRYYVALQLFCSSEGGTERLFPDCGLGLETPDRPFVTSVFKPDLMDYVTSNLSFSKVPCLPDLNLCTPDQAIVQDKGTGRFHVVLPANLVWGASIPNPTHREVTVSNASGRVCDLTVANHSVGCNEWRGSSCCYRAGEGFLAPDEKAGALTRQTVGGLTKFSINGSIRNVFSNRGGVSEFKDYRGSFEFDVEVAGSRIAGYGTRTEVVQGRGAPPWPGWR